MREVFAQRTYRHLFAAQVVALVGTGLLTVGLGLLAYDLAGAQGGQVLGIALTIKMLAYVFVSPVMVALTSRLPRGSVLVGADLVRMAIALSLPFLGEVWQIYLAVFVLQSASATFTPTFQAVIPDILPSESLYTRALSLSRLAYNLESVISPMLAAALLVVIAYNDLFVGTAAGFLGSAILVATARVPASAARPSAGFLDRATRGTRLYLRVPELRRMLALHFAVACGTAMIIVNSTVLVRDHLQLSEQSVPLLLAASGLGEIVVALALPRFLDRRTDRGPMLLGACAIPVLLALSAAAIGLLPPTPGWISLLLLWCVLGMGISLVLTPAGRVIRRSVGEEDRAAAFAADFSLSHACYIVTYLTAGLVGGGSGMAAAALALAALAAVGALGAVSVRQRAPAPA